MNTKNRKKKPRVDTPPKKTPVTKTYSPVYAQPEFAESDSANNNPARAASDAAKGYVEPNSIPVVDQPMYNDGYLAPSRISMVDPPDLPDNIINENPTYSKNNNDGKTELESRYTKGISRMDPQQKSQHIYAEPEFDDGEPKDGYIDLFSTPGNAIYTNQEVNVSIDPIIYSESDTGFLSKARHGCSGCLSQCFGHLSQCWGHLAESFRRLLGLLPGKSKRWILGLVAIVIVLLIIMIILAVYYAAFNNQSSTSTPCPGDETQKAGVGMSEIPVSWSEDSSRLQGLTRSHTSGDSFPIGETPVIYSRNDKVVCDFTVTVIPEELPPNQIIVDNIAGTTLTVSWSVAVNNTPTEDVPYHLSTTNELGTGRSIMNAIQRPAGSGLLTLGYILTSLSPGYGYNIVVSSPDLENDISVFVRTVPLPPSNVTTNPVKGSTSISISWVAPSTEDGLFDKYQIFYKASGDRTQSLAGVVDKTKTDYTIIGLKPSTTYDVFVQTVSGNSFSVTQSLKGVTTSAAILYVSNVSRTTVTVAWYETEDIADEEQLMLGIYRYQEENKVAFTILNDDATKSYQFKDLKPGNLYRIEFSKGPGAEDVIYIRTDPNPAKRSNSEMPPIINDNQIIENIIRWGLPDPTQGSQFDGFIITYEPDDGRVESPKQVEKEVTVLHLDELDAGEKEYMVKIKTFSGMEYLLPSESEELSFTFTVPRIGDNLFIIRKITSSTIKVIWSTDIVANQEPQITLQIATGDQEIESVSVTDQKDNMYTFSGLTPGQGYKIFGMTTAGPSVTAIVTTVPNPVTGLRIISSSPNSITLQWDQYEGVYRVFEIICNACPEDSYDTAIMEYEIQNLSSRTEYTFSVTALSNDRRSTPVVISELTTSG